MCKHCSIEPSAVVLAALRYKVAEISEVRRGSLPLDTVFAEAEAEDRRISGTGSEGGNPGAAERDHLTKKLPGFPPRVLLYRSMRGVLTINHDAAKGFINGAAGEVVDWTVGDDGAVKTVLFQVDGAAEPLTIRPRRSFAQHFGGGQIVRYQFPILDAGAVTVHRVQGATIETALHVLLNSEFFACGQGYVALTRPRRRDQIHLWDLDYNGLIADPAVCDAYAKLRRRPLTSATVVAAPDRNRARVLPLDSPS